MKMDDGEIIREYNAAKNRNQQISILADQNLVTRKVMAGRLAAHGCTVDKRLLGSGTGNAQRKGNAEEVKEKAKTEAGGADLIRKAFFDMMYEKPSFESAYFAGAFEMAQRLIREMGAAGGKPEAVAGREEG